MFESLDARAVGIGIGDFSVLMTTEARRLLGENRKVRPRAFSQGIDELAELGYIDRAAVSDLKELVRLFFEAAREKRDVRAVEMDVREIYARMCLDAERCGTSLAIASVIARNVTRSAPEPPSSEGSMVAMATATITPGNTETGAVGGALVGAGVGGAIGGPLGAAVGAGIGAAAGAAIGWSNESGN